MAVIGAGIVGLCTAFALRERGAHVRVYERGVPGAGQSGGDSRILRHAHADPRLVAFTARSRATWAAWQERLGVELVSGDGVVALGDRALERLASSGAAPVRELPARDLPSWLPVLAPYDGPATLDKGGGATRNRAVVDAIAASLGEALVADEVLGVRELPSGRAEVRAGGATSEHDAVVVCAGRETGALLGAIGVEIPVALAAHVRLTFGLLRGPAPRLACLQDGSGVFGETGVYAAPSPGGRAYGVGLAETIPAHPDGTLQDPDGLAGHAERVRAYAARALPGLGDEVIDVRHCWVTELPWSSDGVAVWRAGPVLAVAGHNLFKNAPGLGQVLARAATGDGLDPELRPEAALGRPPDGD